MEGAERELPLLRCVVFDGDEIASRVVGGIENVEKVSVNSITEMEDVVKRGGFVAVVHVGARLNSAEMARIVNAACEHGTRLGFLVFPMGMERKMRMSSFCGDGRHILIDRTNTKNISVLTETFCYLSGAEAKLSTVREWLAGRRATLLSIAGHSREDVVYMNDALLCSYARRSAKGRLPACYRHDGTCYRDDLPPVNIGVIAADVVFLNGCANFKIGNDVFDQPSSLVFHLLSAGARAVIGVVVVKVGSVEENLFVHDAAGDLSLGEIVLELNKIHVKRGTGVAPFALWGDPRTKLPRLVRPEIDGKWPAPFRFERRGVLRCRNVVVQWGASMNQWREMGLNLRPVAGKLAQLEGLLSGIIGATSRYLLVGAIADDERRKIIRAKRLLDELDEWMVNELARLTYKRGFHFTEAYRDKCIVLGKRECRCLSCGGWAWEVELSSGVYINRKITLCPSCGVVEDSDMGTARVVVQARWCIKYCQIVVYVKTRGCAMAAVSRGEKYGFLHAEREDAADGGQLFRIGVNDVKSHLYQVAYYVSRHGRLTSGVRPVYVDMTAASLRCECGYCAG